MSSILRKEKWKAFVGELSSSMTVYAPTMREGLVRFEKYSPGNNILLDYETTNMPPKSLFLPHGECILEFREGGVSEPEIEDKFVVFMNTLDAEALSILDEVFGGKIKDSHYLRRRSNSVVVAVRNNAKMLNSFSDELNLKFKKGFDVLLTDEGEHYTVQAATKKGEILLKSEYIEKGSRTKTKPEKSKTKKLDLKRISAFLDKGPEQRMWHDLAQECFACGICAYVCPVCHCFDMEDDVKLDGVGCRRRNWDSCMLADFALVAGGVNFRGKRHERIHNWYHHKFARAVEERSRPDCVGCGRCITYCPAKIKIQEKIRECGK